MIVTASTPASAERPVARAGGIVGFQQTDRSAWVIGPALEVAITREIGIRGEAHLELGDFGDPFGPSNIRDGSGPHVNHVMFGPTWRPERYARYAFAAGVAGGVLVMHSTFAEKHFNKKPAVGLFAQAGRMVGPVAIVLQARVDFSATIEMAGPAGEDVPTTCGRLNLVFELPINTR